MHKLIFFFTKKQKTARRRWGEGRPGYAISTSCPGKAERVSLGRSPLAEVMFQERARGLIQSPWNLE